ERQAAISEMVAARAIVDKAENLIPQLAVFENLVRHHATEIARAGDENSPQPHACDPASFERFAYDFSREIPECDVQEEENAPDALRHLVGTAILELVAHVIGLEIQGA